MKEKIFKTAINNFSNEGFFSTSMQKIAEECGMSKATLYKHFESKEDLLIQVFEYTLEQMFERSKKINMEASLTKKERLRERVLVELQENKEYRDFLNLIFKVMPAHQKPRVMSLMKRTRAAFLNWHKEYIIEAYGEEVEPYLWDLVFLLQGTLREYIYFLEDEQKRLDKEHVAALIAYHVDTFIASEDKPIPVLSEEMMNDYEGVSIGQLKKSKEEQIEEVLSDVLIKVEMNRRDQEEVRAAFDTLKKELSAANPQKYMVEALSFFINNRVDIKQEIQIILALVDKNGNTDNRMKEGVK